MSEPKKRKRKGERADGRILVTAKAGYDPDSGKLIRKFFYGRTRAEAERKRKEYLDSLSGGIKYDSRDMTVNEWVDKWIELYEVRTDDYAPYISRIRDDFGCMAIKDVTEGMLVQSLRAYKGKSKSAASKYRMNLTQCFHKAYRNKIISYDPSEDLKLPETTQGTHRALERWEIEAIINHWQVYSAGRWAMLMLLCGLRRGEMAALQWDCVDLKERTITVRRAVSFSHGKTQVKDQTKRDASMRKLPICDELYQMLCETPEEDRNGFVCLSATGSQISGTTVQRNWSTYNKVMTRILNGEKPLQRGFRRDINSKSNEETKPVEKGKKLLFDVQEHDLRHTFATMLYYGGIDVKAAQYYLGHSDIRMTMNLYTHLTEEAEAKKRVAVTGYLDGYLKKK